MKEKLYISKETLCVDRIINVIKSYNRNTNLQFRKERPSDAFIYILSGSCTYSFDDDTVFTVNCGDILYLAYNATYTMQVHTTDYKFIYCDFTFAESMQRKNDVFTPPNTAEVKNLFEVLCRKYKHPSPVARLECMSLLYKIYSIIYQSGNNEYIASGTKDKISVSKAYIDSNFNDINLSVAFLASECDLSEVHYRNRFKALYNIQPVQYITGLRIEKAKELMTYPFLSLEECALQSGFSSLQYFCRVFKKVTGLTPAKYRKGQHK